MDLVKRYIDNVKSLLPRARRDDIAEELADALHSRIDARAAELGRPLQPAEIEAILQGFGHPVMVAARYGPQGRLIGPELFPLWVWSVKLGLFVVVASTLGRAVGALLGANGVDPALGRFTTVWSGLWTGAFAVVGLVTVAFALMERFKFNPLETWRARDLAEPLRFERRPAGAAGERLSQAIALPFNLAVLVTWTLLPFAHGGLPPRLDPFHWLDVLGVGLAPVWAVLWALGVASAAIETGLNLHRLIAPLAVRGHTLWRIGAATVGVSGIVVALTAPRLVDLSPATRAAWLATAHADKVELWMRASLAVVGAALACSLVWQVVRLVRLSR